MALTTWQCGSVDYDPVESGFGALHGNKPTSRTSTGYFCCIELKEELAVWYQSIVNTIV